MKDTFLRNFRFIILGVMLLFPIMATIANAQDQAFVCFDEEAMVLVVETKFEVAKEMALAGRCVWALLYLPHPGTHIVDIDEFSVWMIPTQTEFGLVDLYYFTKLKPPSIVFDGAKS